ncbi:MAG: hypothetical protein Q7S87_11695 [Agitococcus sp.]|nr:hypothetical protein [Agitococcus sp.]
MPNVGIFFVINQYLLIDSVPLAQAEHYGNTLGYGGHYDYWENLQAVCVEEKSFKAIAYDAFPRGRVVYFSQQQQFVVYADKCLNRQQILKVAQAFNLSANQVRLARDEHYQCANCNADFLD